MNEFEEPTAASPTSADRPTNADEQSSVNLEPSETGAPISSSLSGQEVLKDTIPDETLNRFASVYSSLQNELSKVFVGQPELMLGSLVALFSGGHVLVESVPGLGKTLFASALGRALGCEFGRIQFNTALPHLLSLFGFHFRVLFVDDINMPATTHQLAVFIACFCGF